MAGSLSFRVLSALDGRTDLIAPITILALTLVAGWDLVSGGVVVSKDPITQYYPWYSYLGEGLRSLDIPAWNPSQFSGAPFAGDPLSGWTYMPAMILFTILPRLVLLTAEMFEEEDLVFDHGYVYRVEGGV